MEAKVRVSESFLQNFPVLPHWPDIEHRAEVEFTSEDPSHSLDDALRPGVEWGRRAERVCHAKCLLRDSPRALRSTHHSVAYS